MFRIVGCLTADHDLGLVLLAAVICVLGTVASLAVADRLRGDRRRVWLLLLSVCAGSTVWATHFLAMLAYRTTVPTTYEPVLTALSFVLGAVVMGAGFALATREPRNPRLALAGGAVVGSGVSLLHYLGMAAVQIPGTLHYDVDLIAASVILSSGFGAAAIHTGSCRAGRFVRPLAALLAILMIVSLHFAGMGAIRMELGGVTLPTVGEGLSRRVLVVAVTVAVLAVIAIATAAAIVDRFMTLRLASESERYRTLAEGALEGLVVHRDGLLVDANAAARRLLGMAQVDGQQTLRGWFDGAEHADIRARRLPLDEPTEIVLCGAGGAPFPAEVCRRTIRLADGSDGELLAIRDLTARKKTEAQIAHLALHDPLTDLPNRRLFVELANKTISHAQRHGERFAVLAIDLDGFKLVNDMHGHAAGDELLKAVSARVRDTLRDADTLARLGGDEFVVLQSFPVKPGQAVSLAERLLELLSTPFRLSSVEVAISASIGIALFPDDGRTTDALQRSADTAMYRAKADGKGVWRLFEQQMDSALESRRRLELRLRQAIQEQRLDVVYQPQVSSADRSAVGFEALVRWTDDELGSVPPSDFIPVAEETGLIVSLGEFVLRRACHEAVKWSEPVRVAVNLSAVQFRRKGLVEMVTRALEDTGLPGERLELEVTESLLIDNRDDALAILTALKSLGIRIAMDDFGTGYSSLRYLQSFPFDKIKIDRGFVASLETSEQNASIVRAVTSMGQSLHMCVVAEGVETIEQARILRDLRCDELQGYLIARPMAAGEVHAFLKRSAVAAPVAALEMA